MAVTSTILLQSPEQGSSKSEIKDSSREEMADLKLNNSAVAAGSRPKRPGGKSCHQCRQKFYTVHAECHNTKRMNRLCQIKYCTRCLRNRYGERTEEVMHLPNWECPLCRKICNCSNCMKKQGLEPTGKVLTAVRGEGYDNVHECYVKKGRAFLNRSESTSGVKRSARNNGEGKKKRKTERPKEIAENVGGELPPAPELPPASELLEATELHMLEEVPEPEPQLPQGVEVTLVKNVLIPNEDAGNAMQFIKFSSTFEEALKFEQAPETILSIIFHGQPEEIAPVVLCQIRLLTLIMIPTDNPPLDPVDGDRCWLRSLNDCISQSELRHTGLQPPNLTTNAEYAALSPSEKLRILVLLCDESLQTAELRDAIEELFAEFVNGKKEARNKCRAAKEKEEQLQKQMASADENADIQAEIAESQTLLAKYKRKPEALRVAPVYLESSDSGGIVYWRMEEGSQLLRQELNGTGLENWSEKWYAYTDEDAKVIEKHVATSKTKRKRQQRKGKEVEGSSGDEDPPESVEEPGQSQVEPGPSQVEPGPSQVEAEPSQVEAEPLPSLDG